MSTKLLRGGVVLIHDESDHINPTEVDILIENDKIRRIGRNIDAPRGCDIVDCMNKVISPGFIDTHQHLWPTQLKGRNPDDNLLDFMTFFAWQSSNYTPEDVFWGQLGGCLQALDVGTTMVVDHAHITTSADAVEMALSATVSSCLRSVFCYAPTAQLRSWNPVELEPPSLDGWVAETMETVAKGSPYAQGRVTIGLAFDWWFLPKERTLAFFEKAKNVGIRTVTGHYFRNAQASLDPLPPLIDSFGLLDENFILSHCNGMDQKDAEVLQKRNAKVSSTPSIELQMAMGQPVCLREDLRRIQGQCSLGADCMTNTSSSIPGEMRTALQFARGVYNEKFVEKELAPLKLNGSVEEVFNQGTINGARAVRMEDQIGSIAVGKKADLVVFDAASPAMLCGAQQDPVATIVLHSSPGDISDVLVDGNFAKRNGKLMPVQVDKSAEKIAGASTLEWADVAMELLSSRRRLNEKNAGIDFGIVREKVVETYNVDTSKLVHSLPA